jgi:hypothetical protein
VTLAIWLVAFYFMWRANRQLRAINERLMIELQRARQIGNALMDALGVDARTCQACGKRIGKREAAVIRHCAGVTSIGHAMCFPPMIDGE